MKFETYTHQNKPDETALQQIVDFLFVHLDPFGDEKSAIRKCLDYALAAPPAFGGLIHLAKNEAGICGCVVINHTGMAEYIPEHILVYIAVDAAMRGQGLGKKLISDVAELVPGNIALHVEPHNPAKRLYERMGFTNKYLEMRLTK